MPANFHELTANHIGCACPDTAGSQEGGKSHSDGFVSDGNSQPDFCNEPLGFANGGCGRWEGSELSCNGAIRFRTQSTQNGNAFAPLDNEIIGSVHGVEGFGNRVIAVVLRDLAIAADTDNSGETDAKAAAEDAMEKLTLQLAAALLNHFKKTGNTSDLAKVTFPKRALVRLRDHILITKCTEIRDLAIQARDESGALGRGVTQAKITALTDAIALFDDLQRKPRTSIGGSATKRRELVTGVADLVEQLSDLDDLVAQLEPTAPNAPSVTGRSPEAVAAFIADWKRQRKVIDAGHGPSEEDQPPTPPTPPTA